MSEDINLRRRRFFGSAAISIAVAQLGLMESAGCPVRQGATSKVPALRPGTNTSFKSMKQINAGLLNVGYAEDGPANGPPVILLHGWPYDIHSFVDVTPLLASAATASSCRICAATARRLFFPVRRFATVSSRSSAWTSSL